MVANDWHGFVDYGHAGTLEGLAAQARKFGLTHLLLESDPQSGNRTFLAWRARGDPSPSLREVYRDPGARVYEIGPAPVPTSTH